MVNKKKFHGGLKLSLLLLFIILLGSFSTCYASVSEEYVYYLLESCADYSIISNTNQAQVNYLKNFYKSKDNVTGVCGYINYQLSYRGFPNYNDYNLIALLNDTGNSDYIQIYFVFSNCGLNDVYNSGYLRHYPTYFNVMNTTNVPVGRTVQITLRLRTSSYDLTYYTTTGTTSFYFNSQGYTIEGSIINVKNCFNYVPTQTVYDVSDLTKPLLLTDERGTFASNRPIEPEPEEPSGDIPPIDTTGTITNSSGDTTGTIDLSGIQQGIGNIQNQISGDTQKVIENQNQNTQTIVNAISGETEKITNILTDSADDLIDNTIITSGDIESALNFEIAQDPYSNFWFTLTNNLKSALLGTKRSIDISFQGRTWTISLDEYMVLPAWLVIILTPFSTAFFTWVLVRQFKLIFDKLASGNVDSLLKENSEERHF